MNDSPRTTESVPNAGLSHKPPFRRRRLIVDREFQGSIVWRVAVQTGITLFLVSLGMFGPVLVELMKNGGSGASAETAVVMLYLHGRFWWVAAGAMLLAIGMAVHTSHQIAGPLVRFNRVLAALGRGQFPPPLRTRPRDYLKKEVEVLNDAVAGIRTRVDELRRCHGELVAELVHCGGEIRTDDLQRATTALNAAMALSQRLQSQLAQFADVDEVGDLRAGTADNATATPATVGHGTRSQG